MSEDLFAYQDMLARATRDIHARCGNDIKVLWDGGHVKIAAATHRVKIWNGLGSIELEIRHEALAANDTAYQRFLENTASAVKEKLTLNI